MARHLSTVALFILAIAAASASAHTTPASTPTPSPSPKPVHGHSKKASPAIVATPPSFPPSAGNDHYPVFVMPPMSSLPFFDPNYPPRPTEFSDSPAGSDPFAMTPDMAAFLRDFAPSGDVSDAGKILKDLASGKVPVSAPPGMESFLPDMGDELLHSVNAPAPTPTVAFTSDAFAVEATSVAAAFVMAAAGFFFF